MRKISVIASGEAKSAERLATLFNEGNRIRVVTVVTDGDPELLRERLDGCGVEVVGLTPESTPEEIVAIGEGLLSGESEMIALDDYSGMLADWLHDRVPGKLIRLTDSGEAPREVVAALESLDKASHDESAPATEGPKSVDEEWADTLHIDFHTPPAVPGQPSQPQQPAPPQPGPYQAQAQGQYQYQPQWPQGGPSGMAPKGYGVRQPQQREPMPPSYLILSVVMTICCCVVPGIVAIIFSSQVSSKYYSGDIEGAKRASRTAEIWIIVSFVLGVLNATILLPIMFG